MCAGSTVVPNNAGPGGPGGAGNCHDVTGIEEVVEAAESGTSSNVSIGERRAFFRCCALIDEGLSSSESMGEDVVLMDPERSIGDTGLGSWDVVSGA